MLSVDAQSNREITAVILALKLTDRSLAKLIRNQSQKVIVPEWQAELNERAKTPLEKKVLAGTGKVAVSDANVTLRVALGNTKLAGGLRYDDARGVEFGGNRNVIVKYTQKSPKGRTHKVARHTQRQFVQYRKAGVVVYPAVKELVPRILSLWVSTVVKGLHEAFEEKALNG